MIAAATGASRVVIFDHTRRKRVPGADDRTVGTPRRWFYVPEMQPNEAILIKCYDSAPDKAGSPPIRLLKTRPLQPMCCPAKA